MLSIKQFSACSIRILQPFYGRVKVLGLKIVQFRGEGRGSHGERPLAGGTGPSHSRVSGGGLDRLRLPGRRVSAGGVGAGAGALFDRRVTVVNEAASGRSSKSFLAEDRLEAVERKIGEGDYLFIQFGHNDEKREDPSRYTDPDMTFKEYLGQSVELARRKRAFPVLVTPVERRHFKGGKLEDTYGPYPRAVRELREALGVPVIDLTARSRALLERLGEEGTNSLFLWLAPGEHENYPEGVQDNMHFQEQGALAIAARGGRHPGARAAAVESLAGPSPVSEHFSHLSINSG